MHVLGNDACSARTKTPRLPNSSLSCCGGSDRGGKETWRLEHQRMTAAAKSNPALKSLSGCCWRRPSRNLGKADVVGEATGKCNLRAAAVRVLASRERLAEITSGRAIPQQGLTATCKDPPAEASTIGGGRGLVWRMGQYERRRRGNALRGGARRHPDPGNPRCQAKGPWALGGSWAASGLRTGVRRPLIIGNEPMSKPQRVGVYASQRLSLAPCGKTHGGKPRSEPDSGKPTVRDRRGAYGNVGYGGTRNPPHNRKGACRSLSTYSRARCTSIPTRPPIHAANVIAEAAGRVRIIDTFAAWSGPVYYDLGQYLYELKGFRWRNA